MKRSLELFFGVMGCVCVCEEDNTFITVVVEERCAGRRMEVWANKLLKQAFYSQNRPLTGWISL